MNPRNIGPATKPIYCDICLGKALNHKITANSMCVRCDKYLCDICIMGHSSHLMYSIDVNDTSAHQRQFYTQMIQNVKNEGGEISEKFMKDKFVVVDSINVMYEKDKEDCNITGMCITKDRKQWIIADSRNRSIKVFNGSTNTMMRYIKLSSKPWDVTGIPTVTPSNSQIGITIPYNNQIIILDIDCKPASIVQAIRTQDHCHNVYYGKGKFIVNLLHSIQVIDKFGVTINIIHLDYLPCIRILGWQPGCIAVHEDSETIYLCDVDAVCGLSFNGKILHKHSFPFQQSSPPSVCVDKQQNVYVWLRDVLYKLSADLSRFDRVNTHIDLCSVVCYYDTFYLCSSDCHKNNLLIVRHE